MSVDSSIFSSVCICSSLSFSKTASAIYLPSVRSNAFANCLTICNSAYVNAKIASNVNFKFLSLNANRAPIAGI